MRSYLFSKINTLRDFYFLSILSILMILISSSIFLVSDYFNFKLNSERVLKEQNERIRNRLLESLEQTRYTSERIGRQILIKHSNTSKSDPLDYKFIDSLLIGYRDSNNDINSWSTFSWADKNYNLVVSSNVGVIKESIDMSHRDYIPLTKKYPYQMHLGKPVIGVISKLWSIPAGYGITDQRGNYLGAVITGIVIDGLRDRILNSVSDYGIAFAIVDAKGEVLTGSEGFDSNKTKKFIHKLKKQIDKKSFEYANGLYQAVSGYPYGVVTFYKNNVLQESAETRLIIYIILASLIVAFVAFVFFIFYQNLIAPVFELSELAAKVSRGEKLSHPVPNFKITQINSLAKIIRDADRK